MAAGTAVKVGNIQIQEWTHDAGEQSWVVDSEATEIVLLAEIAAVDVLLATGDADSGFHCPISVERRIPAQNLRGQTLYVKTSGATAILNTMTVLSGT